MPKFALVAGGIVAGCVIVALTAIKTSGQEFFSWSPDQWEHEDHVDPTFSVSPNYDSPADHQPRSA